MVIFACAQYDNPCLFSHIATKILINDLFADTAEEACLKNIVTIFHDDTHMGDIETGEVVVDTDIVACS